MLLTPKGKINSNLTKNDGKNLNERNPELYSKIIDFSKGIDSYYTKGHPTPVKFIIRVEWFLKGEINKCPVCSSVIKANAKFCSTKCSANSRSTQKKREESRRKNGDWFKEKPTWGFVSEEGRRKSVETKQKNGTYREVGLKAKRTILEKYGRDIAVENSRKAILEKYGVDNPFQIDEVKKKISETTSTRNTERVDPILYDDEWLLTTLKTKGRSWILSEYGCSYDFIRVRELEVGFRDMNTTAAEEEIAEFLRSNNIECVTRTRKVIAPMELDVYAPDHKLGIEYDGSYWHSAYDKESERALISSVKRKEELCRQNGIMLLRINDVEWEFKKEIWKSMILSKVNRSSFVKVGARQCSVDKVSPGQAKEFFNENHLQGHTPGKYLGLYYKDILVSVLSYSTPRFSDKADIEILRFATLNYYSVSGAFSKLVSKLNGSILSYANKNWSQGDLYRDYEKLSESSFNYHWIKNGRVFTRYQMMKHKLDIDGPADEWLYSQGYRKVIRAGNILYRYK